MFGDDGRVATVKEDRMPPSNNSDNSIEFGLSSGLHSL